MKKATREGLADGQMIGQHFVFALEFVLEVGALAVLGVGFGVAALPNAAAPFLKNCCCQR
jgi:hypothetical protein